MSKKDINQTALFPDFECKAYKEPVLISACFLGIPCRWHGRRAKKRDNLIAELKEKYILVPVCPNLWRRSAFHRGNARTYPHALEFDCAGS